MNTRNQHDVNLDAKVSTLPMMITESNVTVIAQGKRHAVNDAHINFQRIVDLLKNPNATVGEFLDLADLDRSVKKFSAGSISVTDGTVRFKNMELHNSLTRRMLTMMREGFDVSSLAKFMENLMDNPSATAVNELYEFLEQNDLPITPDGYFLAYKRVRDDYKDWHSNSFDNSVGQRLEMIRNLVNDNRHETCSTGFHFCSLEYLTHFHGGQGRIVILKINPKDVVSIPSDYNNSKGRACAYEVVAEHDAGERIERFKSSVNSEFTPKAPVNAPKSNTEIAEGDLVRVNSGDYEDEHGEVMVVFRDSGFARVRLNSGEVIRIHPDDLELNDCGCDHCECD